MLILIAIAACLTIAAFLSYLGAHATLPEERLKQYQAVTLAEWQRAQTAPATDAGGSGTPPPRAAVVQAALQRLGQVVQPKLSPLYLRTVEQQLVQAGGVYGLSAGQFAAAHLLFAALLPGALYVLLAGRMTFATLAATAGLGWLLPQQWLRSRIAARQRAIIRALPDVVDLLTVSVEAGLGFDAAAARVAEKVPGPLGDEFRHYLRMVRMGRLRRDAMRELGERSGVADLRTFATSIIQADQLGVSMSKVLRVQSAEVRRRRRQKAEEQAMKAPIKMLFPLVFCIFPSIFGVLLGPAALNIMNMFMGGR